MPLDGHDYLISQGWSGMGTGLRQGAISRPIAIPQKKNLAGLGKDRDEAFPFWDHLFTAASKSIKLKLASDDESDEETSPLPEIKRTATGIMSNRRPVAGASATTSGTSTPDASDGNPRLNLLAIAKRDAARVSLYARFFRGPILGPDDVVPAPPVESLPGDMKGGQTNQKSIKSNHKKRSGVDEGIENPTKKRKRDPDDVIARAQRKERKREKEERRARRREWRANDEVAIKVAPEDTGKKEKKRRKLESREKEKSNDVGSADQDLKGKGKKKEKSRKGDVTAADIPCEETTLKNGKCTQIDKSTGMLDRYQDVSESTPADQQPSHEARERKKKKRKREEA